MFADDGCQSASGTKFSIVVSASIGYYKQEADACITISQRLTVKGGNKYGIDVDSLNFSDTVSGHGNKPYQDSKLLIDEIINSSEPIQDPQGTNALYWEVAGSFNNTNGIYELLIDPETNTVWHLVYKSK